MSKIIFKNKYPKIYISGQISGLERGVAHGIFAHAKYELEEICVTNIRHEQDEEVMIKNFTIINPFEIHAVNNELITWDEYMLEDIKYLFRCNTIYLLRNWENSKGAKVEKAIAEALNFQVIYQ